MAFALKLIPQKTSIRFIRWRWIGFALTFCGIVATGLLLQQRGLNLGIDFTGGILMEVRTPEPADLSELRPLFNPEQFGEVSLQHFGDEQEVLIRIPLVGEEEQAALVEQAKELLLQAEPEIDFRQVDYVGPTVGRELVRAGAMSLTLAFAAVLCYVWFRFEWQFGLGAILALIHDAILTLGFFAATRLDFSLASIAAILTIIGYSINDSVVIYDRIRENMRKYKKMPMEELIDRSVNDTLSRTIMTGLTTLLAAGALSLWGGEVIRGFSLALVFGVIIGTYSSIYVSAPVLIYFHLRKQSSGS